MELKNLSIAVNFFDLSGNNDYKMIREEFYADAQGLVMVFDIDNRDSFTDLVSWETEMKKNGIDKARVKIVVCANKCDAKGREVSTAEG